MTMIAVLLTNREAAIAGVIVGVIVGFALVLGGRRP